MKTRSLNESEYTTKESGEYGASRIGSEIAV